MGKSYENWIDLFLLFLIFLFAAFLRVWKIWEVFHPHELMWGYESLKVIKKGIVKHFFQHPALAHYHGPLSYYPIVFSIYLLGRNVVALKLPFVLSGLLGVVFTYFLAKELYSRKEGLLATFIITILPGHFILSTVPLQYIFPSVFVVITLYLFYKYNRTMKSYYLYLASFVAGLGIMMRVSFIFFLLPFVTLALILKFKLLVRMYRQFLLALFFFLLPFIPVTFRMNENIKTMLSLIEERYPITPHGINLMDVKNNLKNGLFKLFPLFFFPSFYYFNYPFPKDKIFNFFNVFVFLSAVFLAKILININAFCKQRNSVNFSYLKKDLFILFCTITTVTLTSILAFTIFHIEEYVIVSSLLALICARGISEILTVGRRWHIRVMFLILILAIIFFSIYPVITCFIHREVSDYMRYLPKVTEIINSTTFSVRGDHVIFHNALGWYGIRVKEHPILILEREEYTISSKVIEMDMKKDEKMLYIFHCFPNCESSLKLQQKFEEKIKVYKKSIEKKTINLGGVNYTIYKVI